MIHRLFPAFLFVLFLAINATNGQYIDPQIDRLFDTQTKEVQMLIIMKKQADLTKAKHIQGKLNKSKFVFQQLRQTAEESQLELLQVLNANNIDYQSFYITNAIKLKASRDIFNQLKKRPDISQIIYDAPTPMQRIMEEYDAQSLRSAEPEWGLKMINADKVWQLGYTGEGIVVGGQDTGYDWLVSPLREKYRGYTGDTIGSHDYNWHDAIREPSPLHADSLNPCGFDVKTPCDDHNHGTHTMGTMVGSDSTNSIGVAPEAKWIACRNMDRGYGSPSTYTECFEWFLAPTDINGGNPDPSKAPHVINNSWGCPEMEGCNPTNWAFMDAVVNNLKAAGIVVVVSAGNNGPSCNTVSNPAAIFEGSFSVGATNDRDTIAGFSSRGTVNVDSSYRIKPNVSAPGVRVRSVIRNGEFRNFSGTSMAGPHVAGAVALLINAVPELDGEVKLIESILEQSAVPLITLQECDGLDQYNIPNPTYGHGRIDILKAIELAREMVPEFAPVGAEWVYEATRWEMSPKFIYKVTSIGDTVINGRDCKILQQDKTSCNVYPEQVYVNQILNKIYYYWEPADDFYLLYDLSRSINDTFHIPYIDWKLETKQLKVVLDSIYSTTIDGHQLTIHNQMGGDIHNQPIALPMGGLHYLFEHELDLCDAAYVSKLRCYSDENISVRFISDSEECGIINSTIDVDQPISIFPNPAVDKITLKGINNDEVTIHNTIGQMIHRAKIHNSTIDVSTLSSGIYLVKFGSNSQTAKFVKL